MTRLVVFGDSLAAGYGLATEEALPAVLERLLHAEGRNVSVVNAGISGETTAGAKARVESILELKPDGVILIIGGNDLLRGLPPEHSRKNIEHIVKTLKEQKVEVLLAGMKAPLNYGPEYASSFNRLYEEIAEEQDAALYDFFFEGVINNPDLMQQDGIHPNAQGVETIAKSMLSDVGKLLVYKGVSE